MSALTEGLTPKIRCSELTMAALVAAGSATESTPKRVGESHSDSREKGGTDFLGKKEGVGSQAVKGKVTVVPYQPSKLSGAVTLNKSAVNVVPSSPNMLASKARDPFDIDKAFEELDSIKSKIGETKPGRGAIARNPNILSTGNVAGALHLPLSEIQAGGSQM